MKHAEWSALQKQVDSMTNEELNSVITMVKERRDALARRALSTIKVGDLVEFNGKRHRVERGAVQSVGVKNVVVKTEGGVTWRVAATLLRAWAPVPK